MLQDSKIRELAKALKLTPREVERRLHGLDENERAVCLDLRIDPDEYRRNKDAYEEQVRDREHALRLFARSRRAA